MPGTYVFKPIEAKLTHNTDFIGKMNPYCTFVLGKTKINTQVCKKGGKHPHWNDSITIPNVDEKSYSKVQVELMDKDLLIDDTIASFEMDLQELQLAGQVSKWYPVFYRDKPAGEILMEASFQPGFSKESTASQSFSSEEKIIAEQETITLQHQEPPVVFTEQKQVIEPHTFTKDVETVEIRAGVKEIEVMEPIKVIKEVPVTEPVTITKLVEVTKPEVVTKVVEVMEPRLVTKTIQVVEDVPVMREVQVVELKTSLEEVQTVEPQTTMQEVEVTEYRPVHKQVLVTEPVTVKKSVEYVEPVITTLTVTKEIPQAVVVDEKITTSVGPATVVDIGMEKFKESMMMTEEIQKKKVVEVIEQEITVKEKVIEEVVEEVTVKDVAVGIEKVQLEEIVERDAGLENLEKIQIEEICETEVGPEKIQLEEIVERDAEPEELQVEETVVRKQLDAIDQDDLDIENIVKEEIEKIGQEEAF